MKKIAIGSDHIGINHKAFLIEKLKLQGYELLDKGTFNDQRTDYPLYAEKVALAIQNGEADCGILICGTGIGISIAANKFPHIRCALCADEYSALMSREHNDSNIIAFGAKVVSPEKALALATLWINTQYEGGRHQRRLDMIDRFEHHQY
ncbi:ribose 5-phosphate isomerase B [Gallibacterium anatis]|uniref:Ribose-5-phosphate isomerase B n=4 Tax=Gallibacterium anatis TaxID=750 RepID=F4H973_GALAU|nr:ribose 5-phosphate isomerase B [Gallibacterium anatis]AEC17149.1 ribose-5-phosphate isomerase B [Gallibacterium anatis UMN179]ERF78168.1 ribose 5-phosphate isomerase [Gallibacterium anatis 12656/12]KGQ49625.1 ribose 5-phosphate isomerase [Gallibacterium anatis]KGQ62112.1 ribose 5-phosphate isomerase [Gallibacterium anatis 4895]KGQ65177.1 ribose 5-phosphate isomerase [Gallibacterium anatis]